MYWFARFVEPDQPLTPPGKLCWSNYRHSSCFLNEVLNNSESANTQHVLCKLQVSNQSAFSNNIRCPPWKCRSCQNGSPLFIDWLLLLIALPPPTLAAWFDLFFPFSFHLTCARSRPLVTSDNCILFPFLFFLLFKIVAIAHPFQTSQNPTRYVWTIVQTGTHLSHDGSLSLVLLAWYPR